MTELEKALDAVSPVYGDDPEGAAHLNTILDAARRLLNLTSPETIEKAARALFLKDGNFSAKVWDALHDTAKQEFRELVEAVLRSVEEGNK